MDDPVYLNYWRRKHLLQEIPHFPLRRWWRTDRLCDIEKEYFEIANSANRLIDVGAGDLRIQEKFLAAGYAGTYHTQDIGGEFEYTYRSLDEVEGEYDVVLCFDVLEHLTLRDGLYLFHRLIGLLNPGGSLIIQTPNARCIRFPLGSDITHIHIYNLTDLWTYARALGMNATGYRIWFTPAQFLPIEWVWGALGRFVITRLLGCDYADNIALIVRKPSGDLESDKGPE